MLVNIPYMEHMGKKWYIFFLVGGFNHLEKYSSMGRIIPYTMENKTV